MTDHLTPAELRELLGAFALGAVDDDERALVEELVLHDTDARAELHQLEHAVAWLGHASPRASEASWQAVRDQIAADTEPDVITPVAPVAPVASLAEHRARRPRWQRLTAVAAALALVIGGTLAVRELTRSDPTATTVALAGPDGAVVVTARIASDGHGHIVTSSLPSAPAGHEYQLWAQSTETQPIQSAGLLGPSPAGEAISVPRHAVRIAISVEPTGGSRAPTTTPVAISSIEPL